MICVSYAPDTSVEDEIKKGAFDLMKETVQSISRLDDIMLLTKDIRNYSSLFEGFHSINHFPCGDRRIQTNKYAKFLAYYLKGIRVLMRERAKLDAIISMTPASVHDAFFSVIAGKPHILSYEYDLPNQLLNINKDYLSAFVSLVVERVSIKHAALIRIVSKDQYKKIHKLTRSKVVLIPNFVDLDNINRIESLFMGKKDRSHQTILFVGRLHPVKRVEDLIIAFSIVLGRSSNVKLIIIGDGPEREKLQELTNKLSCSDNVQFTGFLPHDQVLGLIVSSDALVLPSLEEGNPRVIIESLACKIPVVATDVVGIRGIIQDGVNGLLVSPKNPDALAIAISRILNDKRLRLELSQNGFDLVKNEYEAKECLNRFVSEIRCTIPDRYFSVALESK